MAEKVVFITKTSRRGRPPKVTTTSQKRKFFREGNELPKCLNKGCKNPVQVREWKYWSFRSECSTCMCARKNGKTIDGIVFHKKTYCENTDAHLGFRCPVKKWAWKTCDFSSSLDLDHIDGNHSNNKPSNIKTYCKMCHMRKSIVDGDCSAKKKSARIIDHV